MCQIDNCINYFEDIIHINDKTNTNDESTNKIRRTRKPTISSYSDIDNLENFVPNPNKISKLFIQLGKQKIEKIKNKTKKSKKSKPLKGLTSKTFVLLQNISLELINDENPFAKKQFGNQTNLEIFFVSQMYNAALTRVGIFYELLKFSQSTEATKFFDKFLKKTTRKFTWPESVAILATSLCLIQFIVALMVSLCAEDFYFGLFVHSLNGVVSCVLACLFHLLLVFFYKGALKLWINVSLKKQRQYKNVFLIILIIISAVFSKLTDKLI